MDHWKVDPRDQTSGLEGNLLCFGKKIVDTAVEDHATNDTNRHLLFRDDLGGVQHIKFELFSEFVIEDLNSKFPLRKIAHLDCVPHITAMKVRIRSVEFQGFIPDHRLQPLFWVSSEI